MVAVNLQQLILSMAADPTDAVGLKMLIGSTASWPVSVSQSQYTKGRTRLVGGPRADVEAWTVQLGQMPIATAIDLKDRRAGRLHWARDPHGLKMACYWDDAPITWQGRSGPQGQLMAIVSLTLKQITHAEVTS